jgi:calcium-translocating P-type ATPase
VPPTAPERSGLSPAEAAARLRADGPNRLPEPKRPSALRRFIDQLTHFFAVMLWVAGGLAFVADLPQLGVAIGAVVVLNALFSFLQERRADHAAERLRSLLPLWVGVWRGGRKQHVDASEIVVDDLLVLEAGDRVPADATVTLAHGALVDTSLLTGESEPTTVQPGAVVHAGTFLVEGEVDALVTATGAATRLATIARLTTETSRHPTPLTLELHRVVRTIAAIAMGVGAVFFGLSLALGNPAADGFVFAIGVTVALVPEALLPTVTLSLAWGAEQMAKRQVLVRELDAVETLGSTTFICTDKTGTLTRNEMTVVDVWTPAGSVTVSGVGYEPVATVVPSAPDAVPALRRAALAAVRCSAGFTSAGEGGWIPHGDPMEAAIDALARRAGIDTDQDRARAVAVVRFPFDPRRRRMSIVHDDTVLVKGAPDAVLPRCLEIDAEPERAIEAMTAKGLRVLAVAGRPVGAAPPVTAAEAEAGLELYGVLGLHDPPRKDVGRSIAQCRRAGIKVAMVTGDHPATAAAIATEVGLRSHADPVVTGDELPDDAEALATLLDHDGVVVARVSPEAKLRIAQALRARGHVVAMTGDGVNDGPALHEADIGIAMGRSGTDVAREAADLVLLDDNFASIVAAVEQGRSTYVNIRRFLTYHLTDNVAELTPFVVWALSGGHFPLALGVLQILALDIGTDTLSATALGAEPPAGHLLEGPPVSGRLMNHTVLRRAFGLLGPAEAAASMAAFTISMAVLGWRPGRPFPTGGDLAAASGAAFMAVVLAQTANVFACRSSSRWPGALGWTSNRLLIPAAAVGLTISLLTVFVPPVAEQLGQANPPVLGWVVGAAAMVVVLLVDALDKRHRRARPDVRS